MSLEIIQGFDNALSSNGVPDMEWDSGSDWANNAPAYNQGMGTPIAGRFGGYAGGGNGNHVLLLQKSLARVSTRVFGMAVKFGGYYNHPGRQGLYNSFTGLFNWREESTNLNHVVFGCTAVGELFFASGNNVLAITVPYFLRLNAWYYIEGKVTIGTPGYYELRIGESTIFSGTDITQQSSNAYTDGFIIGPNNHVYIYDNDYIIDDLYVLNNLGTKNNDFLGERKVITSVVSSDYSIQFNRNDSNKGIWSNSTTYNIGDVIQFTDSFQDRGTHYAISTINGNLGNDPSSNLPPLFSGGRWVITPATATTNYQNLIDYDADTTYNYSENIGDIDLFTVIPLSITPNLYGEWYWGNNIDAIKVTIIARKNDVGYRNIAILVNSNTSTVNFPFNVISAGYSLGIIIPLLSNYEATFAILENDPFTGDTWTEAAVNACRIGYELIG
jgi:hypothetical protein